MRSNSFGQYFWHGVCPAFRLSPFSNSGPNMKWFMDATYTPTTDSRPP